MREIPHERWDPRIAEDATVGEQAKPYVRHAALLDQIDAFDPAFFNVSPKRAKDLDPQQRLALELAWEAFEDAGLSLEVLRGTRTGVFAATVWPDYALFAAADLASAGSSRAAGHALGMIANRVSFFLDVEGPSMTVETGCSGGLVALHLAVQSLRAGESEQAIVLGVHLIAHPATQIELSQLGALSLDGRCKAFDAAADGYGRGEGGGALVLKPLRTALRDGDRIRAVIRETAVNNDGGSKRTLTAPNERGQSTLLRHVYGRAGDAAERLVYVEAHGTGTPTGDPVEARSLGVALGRARKNGPLPIGSVKTNVGHLEGASSLASLVKAVLVLEKGAIPATKHFKAPNPQIPMTDLNLRVVATFESWERRRAGAVVGVCSYGWGGTNAHGIVEESPTAGGVTVLRTADAADAAFCTKLVQEIVARPKSTLDDVVRALAARPQRATGNARWVLRAAGIEELRRSLAGVPHAETFLASSELRTAPRGLSLFLGRPSPALVRLGAVLYATEPIFAAAVDTCVASAPPDAPSVIDALISTCANPTDSDNDVREDRALHAAGFTVLVALGHLLRAWGLEATRLDGQGIGAIAAQAIANQLTMRDAWLRVVSTNPPEDVAPGVMDEHVLVIGDTNVPHTVEALEDVNPHVPPCDLNMALRVTGREPLPLDALHATRARLFLAGLCAEASDVEASLLVLSARTPAALGARAADLSTWLVEHPETSIRDICFTLARRRTHFEHRAAIVMSSRQEAVHLLETLARGESDPGLIVDELRSASDRAIAPNERPESRPLHGDIRGWARFFVEGGHLDPMDAGIVRGRVVTLPAYRWQRTRHWLDAPFSIKQLTTAVATGPKLAFLFTGQGAQYPGMGRGLEVDAGYRGTMDKAAAVLDPLLGRSLRDLLYSSDAKALEDTRLTQPALFALEVALASMWRARGVIPDALLGHSLGELAAACVSGVMSLEDGLRVVAERGRLLGAVSVDGGMLRVVAGEPFVRRAIEHLSDRVSVAAINGPRDLVLAGDRATLEELAAHLAEEGVKARMLRVSHPFHSPLIEPALEPFERFMRTIQLRAPRGALVSSVTGEVASAEFTDPTYWSRQMRLPVQFARGVQKLKELGCRSFLEIGPHPTLLGLAAAAELPGEGIRFIPSLERGSDDVAMFDRAWRATKPTVPDPGLAHAMVWRKVDLSSSTPPPPPRRWVVIGSERASLVAERLHARGVTCSASPTIGCDVEDASVVYVAQAHDPSSARAACLELLELARKMRGGRLWIVTTGAQAITADDPSSGLFQAPLWGLGRTLCLEQPDIWGGLIDADAARPPAASNDALLEVLLGRAGDEDQIAVRDGQVFVPRLERVASEGVTPELSAERTYLVTGGLGALGLLVAEWLVERGARRVLLVGRRGLPPRRQWDVEGEELGPAMRAIQAMESRGARVSVHALDVADGAAVAALIRMYATSDAPIAGIVHAAGVVRHVDIAHASEADVALQMEAKVDGAWNLHASTLADPLDFFVLFSSISATWGSRGLGVYGAANHFLDALAAHRRSLGQPAVSIAWGPWGGLGMAEAPVVEDWKRAGLLPLESRECLDQLGALLSKTSPRDAVVARVDWERFYPLLSARRPRPFLSELVPKVEETHARAPSPLRARITRGKTDTRALLLTHVRELAGAALGVSPSDIDVRVGLFAMGLDSLAAVELRKRLAQDLGLELPATLVLDHPTAAALATYLDDACRQQDAKGPDSELAGEDDGTSPSKRTRAVRASDDGDTVIAIVGAACRLPSGIDSPEHFWTALREGRDATGPFPDARLCRMPAPLGVPFGGFLLEVDTFDAEFFGIAPREAASLDPQHRLLLEVAWEAIEAAGCTSEMLTGSRTGVFVGITTDDYAKLQIRSLPIDGIDPYFPNGNHLNAAAGRIAYTFGLRGPCLAVDTACSSSLVAVHLACQALRSGECDQALVGGVNLVLSPELTSLMSRAGMVSADGRCKTFDAAADGYGRGEGCVVVMLKSLAKARADNDHVLATILGSAINQDGRSAGFTVPNSSAQSDLIRSALARAGLRPVDIDYVEAHGTGTPLGDPIEFNGLRGVFAGDRSEALWVGSVKSNLGHLESAAGLTGLLKVALMLDRGEIAPHRNLSTLNPNIDLDAIPARIPLTPVAWGPSTRPRRAGVSAFGFSGTNAHVIVEEAPDTAARGASDSSGAAGGFHFLPVSARTPAALADAKRALSRRLRELGEGELEAACYTASLRRSHHDHRAVAVGRTVEELVAALEEPSAGVAAAAEPPRLVFVCSGQGGQWQGMARTLRCYEVFDRALKNCAEAVKANGGPDVLACLDAPPGAGDTIDIVQPVVFAIQVALCALWRSMGVAPAAVMGHSMGEVAAAHLAGLLDIDAAARVIVKRSALLRRISGGGGMALVESREEDVRSMIAAIDPALGIAAINSPRSCVIAGPRAAVERATAAFAAKGAFARLVDVDVAAHSAEVDPLLAELGESLAGLPVREGSIPFYSTVTSAIVQAVDATYWQNNLRRTVRFADGVRAALADGLRGFVELGPHPVLVPALEQNFDGSRSKGDVAPSGRQDAEYGDPQAFALGSMRRNEDEVAAFLRALGVLHVRGARIDYRRLHAGARPPLQLHAYPWQRETHWFSAPIAGEDEAAPARAFPGQRVPTPSGDTVYATHYTPRSPAFLDDHRIVIGAEAPVVVPGSSHLARVIAAARQESPNGPAWKLTQVEFRSALALREGDRPEVQLVLRPADGDKQQHRAFLIASQGANSDAWTTHATGVLVRDDALAPVAPSAAEIKTRCPDLVEGQTFYARFRESGYALGPTFRWIRRIHRGPAEVLVELSPGGEGGVSSSVPLHAGLIDSCFQAASLALPGWGTLEHMNGQQLYAPFMVESFRAGSYRGGGLFCHVRLRGDRPDTLELLPFDLSLFDETGAVIAEIAGFWLKRLDRKSLAATSDPLPGALLTPTWVPRSWPEATLARTMSFLLVAGGPDGRALALALEKAGHRVIVASLGDRIEERSGELIFRPGEASEVRRLLEQAGEVDHVVHLGGIEEYANDVIAQERGCGQALAIVQGMLTRRASSLWLVTRGSQATGTNKEALSPTHGSLWGFGRVVGLEQPGLACRLVDLELGGHDMSALVRCLTTETDENEIALRGGERLVMRLRVAAPTRVTAPPPRLRSDAAYVVTGGLGGLGRAVAVRLAELGAGHVVVLGRRVDEAVLARLEAEVSNRGAVLHAAVADVGDPGALRRAFDAIEAGGTPIRGVVHAAGVLIDGLVETTSLGALSAVMASKVHGALNLHRATRERTLDFFVLFGAGAAILGNLGQAAYAAANAFLDSLAHARRAEGLPAVTIDWGVWSEIGLVGDEESVGRLAQQGLGALSPAVGLDAFSRLLASPMPQVAVIPADWKRFFERLPMAVNASRFRELAEGIAVRDEAGDLRARLLRTPAGAPRRRLLETMVREQVAAVMRLAAPKLDPNVPLGRLGLDSLMGLEIRNRLERQVAASLPATLVWNHPTVAALTSFLLEKLVLSDAPVTDAPVTDAPLPAQSNPRGVDDADLDDMFAEVENLDDDAIRSLLARTAK